MAVPPEKTRKTCLGKPPTFTVGPGLAGQMYRALHFSVHMTYFCPVLGASQTRQLVPCSHISLMSVEISRKICRPPPASFLRFPVWLRPEATTVPGDTSSHNKALRSREAFLPRPFSSEKTLFFSRNLPVRLPLRVSLGRSESYSQTNCW